MSGYGAIEDQTEERAYRSSAQAGHAKKIFVGLCLLAVAAVCAVAVMGSRNSESIVTMKQVGALSVPDQAVRYVTIPGSVSAPVQFASASILPATAQSLSSIPAAAAPHKASQTSMRPIIEYVPLKELEALEAQNHPMAAHLHQSAPRRAVKVPVQHFAVRPPPSFIRQQQLAVGGAGVYRGQQLEDAAPAAPAAAAAAPAAPVMPAPITPPTPQEISLALQRIQEREIQQQTFKDTLIDAQTGQPLHVPGVPGSSHNGVSGIGGVFGVGGFLGPSYPVNDQVAPLAAFSTGPACTCTSCTGSPPVCTGCTCRR